MSLLSQIRVDTSDDGETFTVSGFTRQELLKLAEETTYPPLQWQIYAVLTRVARKKL